MDGHGSRLLEATVGRWEFTGVEHWLREGGQGVESGTKRVCEGSSGLYSVGHGGADQPHGGVRTRLVMLWRPSFDRARAIHLLEFSRVLSLVLA